MVTKFLSYSIISDDGRSAILAGKYGTGLVVDSAGDVNGDGFADLIASHGNGAHIVFGKASFEAYDVLSLNGKNGFNFTSKGDQIDVSSAGDIDGDGFDDLIVGAPTGAHIIFGKASGFAASLNATSLNGSNGFSLVGGSPEPYAGFTETLTVSSAGDLNGDGFDDLLVGNENADAPLNLSGKAYVVFGKSGGFTASLDVSALNGTNGFQINGSGKFDFLGQAVSSAGDVNSDGFDDLVIGSRDATYVVFGSDGSFAVSIDVSSLNGKNGFRIAENTTSVSTAGDINGDGVDDVVAHEYDESFVIFGRTTGFPADIQPSALDGKDGFRILGGGSDISGIGDFNGDGVDDIAIGGEDAISIVLGRTEEFTPAINLKSQLDPDIGFTIFGGPGEFFGRSVAGAGDVNKDGFADIIVGTPTRAVSAVTIIFGRTDFPLTGNFIGTGKNEAIAGTALDDNIDGSSGNDTLVGGSGADTIDGNLGNDLLNGGDGADALRGSDDSDTLAGGAGRDTLDGGGSFGGADFADYSADGAVHIDLDTSSFHLAAAGDKLISIEGVIGSATGGDLMIGGIGDHNFRGLSGKDKLDGGERNDTLSGGGGNDLLLGRNGEDSLAGGAGNDRIRNDAGNDSISGGKGADAFIVINARFGKDIITDFTDGADKLLFWRNVADAVTDFDISGNGTKDVTLSLAGDTKNSIALHSRAAITLTDEDFLFFA